MKLTQEQVRRMIVQEIKALQTELPPMQMVTMPPATGDAAGLSREIINLALNGQGAVAAELAHSLEEDSPGILEWALLKLKEMHNDIKQKMMRSGRDLEIYDSGEEDTAEFNRDSLESDFIKNKEISQSLEVAIEKMSI